LLSLNITLILQSINSMFLNFLQLPGNLADLAIPIEPLFCHVVEFVCFTLFSKLPHALSYVQGMSVLNSELGKTGDLHVVCARLSVHLSVRPPSQGGQTSLLQYTFPKVARQA
jgi:hypothetical protein